MAQLPKYSTWAQIPEGLATRTQLGRMGLKLAKGQAPVAIKLAQRGSWSDYDLYEVAAAIPKRQATEAQLKALEQARAAAAAAMTCIHCGRRRPSVYRSSEHLCRDCLAILREWEMQEGARQKATAWAREVLADPAFIILDTETTGLASWDEVVQIAIIDALGQPLMNTLIRPTVLINPEATAVHGLADADVVNAPTIADVQGELTRILSGASRVIIYNVEFDKAKLNRSLVVRELRPLAKSIIFECAMESYAEWCGEWSDYYKSFKWQPLPFGDHTAFGDCLGTLKLLRMMADIQEVGNGEQ